MPRFKESRLEFRFEAPWNLVFQWDKLPAYRQGLAKLSSTTAVDFIGPRSRRCAAGVGHSGVLRAF